jgi:hypothetical protein
MNTVLIFLSILALLPGTIEDSDHLKSFLGFIPADQQCFALTFENCKVTQSKEYADYRGNLAVLLKDVSSAYSPQEFKNKFNWYGIAIIARFQIDDTSDNDELSVSEKRGRIFIGELDDPDSILAESIAKGSVAKEEKNIKGVQSYSFNSTNSYGERKKFFTCVFESRYLIVATHPFLIKKVLKVRSGEMEAINENRYHEDLWDLLENENKAAMFSITINDSLQEINDELNRRRSGSDLSTMKARERRENYQPRYIGTSISYDSQLIFKQHFIFRSEEGADNWAKVFSQANSLAPNQNSAAMLMNEMHQRSTFSTKEKVFTSKVKFDEELLLLAKERLTSYKKERLEEAKEKKENVEGEEKN